MTYRGSARGHCFAVMEVQVRNARDIWRSCEYQLARLRLLDDVILGYEEGKNGWHSSELRAAVSACTSGRD